MTFWTTTFLLAATLSPSAEPSPETVDSAAAPADDALPARWIPRSQRTFAEPDPVPAEKVSFRPGKGLQFESKSGRFGLTLGLRVQMRYSLTKVHEPDVSPSLVHGFQIRRARLVFSGHVFGKHNKFKSELSFSPRDIGLLDGNVRFTILRDFYLEFDYLRDLTVRVGQYKVPYSHQRVVSSGKLQLVDRAIVGSEFDLDRDIGLELTSKDFLGLGRLRYHVGAYMGQGRDNFVPEPLTEGGGLVYLARIEVLPLGMFDDYVEGDFDRSLSPRLALGVGYAYMDDATLDRGTKGRSPADGGTTDYHNTTASLVFKIAGLSASGEFFWRTGRRAPGDVPDVAVTPARSGLGWFGQVGYMVPRIPFEFAARYGEVRPLGPADETAVSNEREVGGGVSWYPGGHPFKLQGDYFRLWGEGPISHGVDEVRVQVQLAF